jgi:hypothetical protein
MSGELTVLRAGEYLVSRACRRLPAGVREERRQEWLAELPVILRDRGSGPAPLRAARMLAFAADTLRGTILRRGAYRSNYRGAHRGAAAQGDAVGSARWLAAGLLMGIGVLLLLSGALLFLVWDESSIIHQLIAGPNFIFSATLVLTSLIILAATWIPRWDGPVFRWWAVGRVVLGAGLLVRASASRAGWGHPLLFAIISYCGYAIWIACFGVLVVQTARSLRDSDAPGGSPATP